MAVRFLQECDVSDFCLGNDLCLGKPPLRSLSASSNIAHALAALNNSEDNISVWTYDYCIKKKEEGEVEGGECCRCIGKVCMVEVVCFLSREDNLLSPSQAIKASLSVILTQPFSLLLLEMLDLIFFFQFSESEILTHNR
ncbi:hypothetical protein AHAS_Ahas02G0206900 [Arachis hypogaea]